MSISALVPLDFRDPICWERSPHNARQQATMEGVASGVQSERKEQEKVGGGPAQRPKLGCSSTHSPAGAIYPDA